jgi:hypothetical protein
MRGDFRQRPDDVGNRIQTGQLLNEIGAKMFRGTGIFLMGTSKNSILMP